MRTVAYPLCCGFKILTGFPGSGTVSSLGQEQNPDKVISYVRRAIENNYRLAGLICVLDANQRLIFHDRLLELGFKVGADAFMNMNHFSLLTVYTYELNPKTMEQKLADTAPNDGSHTIWGRTPRRFFDVPERREQFFPSNKVA